MKLILTLGHVSLSPRSRNDSSTIKNCIFGLRVATALSMANSKRFNGPAMVAMAFVPVKIIATILVIGLLAAGTISGTIASTLVLTVPDRQDFVMAIALRKAVAFVPIEVIATIPVIGLLAAGTISGTVATTQVLTVPDRQDFMIAIAINAPAVPRLSNIHRKL